MATETVNHAGNPGIDTKAEVLRHRAMNLLQEMRQESEKAFAIATAGQALVGENAITERCLFTVIEDILSDAVLQTELERTITELASLADTREASHG